MDQNEKLVRFGVTHVAAIDGFSGYIVGHIIMPVKNNAVIYEELFRYLEQLLSLLYQKYTRWFEFDNMSNNSFLTSFALL
jgi:hypothetical protein